MKTLSIIISTLLGVLLAKGVLAEKPESTMFYMNSRNSYYQTTFTMASHLVVLPFCINGFDSINMIFDTGVGRTIITEISNPYIVSLNRARKVKVRGLGTSESVEGIVSNDNVLTLGKIHGKSQEVLVVPNNTIDLSARTGHPINGLIGRTIFEQFIVEINYSNQTIRFHNPQRFNHKVRKNEAVIPIELIDGRPFINAHVTIDGKEISVKLLFDTGMSMALWLDPFSSPDIKPSTVRRQEIIGQGLNGDISGEISRVEKFRIGPFELNDVFAAFPDSSAIQGTTENNGRNGSVGADVFRRFNVIIDYPNRQIILRKNSNFKSPFTCDMSGIEISPIVMGLPFYKIASIGKNTPASECGLMVNDELRYINGISTKDMTISQINDVFRSREGKTIRMTVVRDGISVDVKFKLRKLI
ncbi:MAG: aspartyl protease family protein [Bacteroidales bacterium]